MCYLMIVNTEVEILLAQGKSTRLLLFTKYVIIGAVFLGNFKLTVKKYAAATYS